MAETVSSTSGREGLNVRDGALVGAGMICVSGAAIFYKQKRTLPFKLAYFLSWPLLGAALINTFGPRRAAFEQELKERGLNELDMRESRQLAQIQLNQLRGAAEEGKHTSAWPSSKDSS